MRIRSFFAALAAAAAFLCLPAQATLSSTASTVSYSGNGATTSFTVPYRFLLSSDLVVTTTDSGGIVTTKALGTDYTVTGAGTQSGTLTFTVAPASGLTIAINRVVDLKQLLSIRGTRLLDQASLENELDKLAMGEQQLQAGVGALGGDISGASVKITGTTTSVNLADLLSVLPIPAKAFGVKCDGSDEHVGIQACVTAAVQCVLPPSTNCSIGSTTLIVPTAHRIVGHGMQGSILKYAGAGCGVQFDGNDSGGAEKLKISVSNTAGTVRNLCLTNVNGPTLRLSFSDVYLLGAQSPPISGAYCLFIHSTTGNSLYYSLFSHLITQNCDRGVELLGDIGGGLGGANANWWVGYSANANNTGVFYDGKVADNYVQGHCNGGGTTFAQTCSVFGDGTNATVGNTSFMVSDQGDGVTTGQSYQLKTPSNQNMIFSIDESVLPPSSTADSTNFMFTTRGLSSQGNRNAYLPSSLISGINTISTGGAGSATFFGGSVSDTSTTVKTNIDYSIASTLDRNVCSAGLTAPHTFTLPGGGIGRRITVCDSDGSITGTNTLTIAPPATGRVNGSTSGIILNSAWKSADCKAPTSSGLIWACQVSP